MLTPALLTDVFGLSAQVIPDPQSGCPIVIPVRPHHDERSDAQPIMTG